MRYKTSCLLVFWSHHPKDLPISGAWANVVAHGTHFFANLYPGCFRRKQSSLIDQSRVLGGPLQIHHRNCHKPEAKVDLDKWNARSHSYSDWLETVDGFVRPGSGDQRGLFEFH